MNLPCARLNCSNCISYLLSHYLSLVSCLSISLFSSLDPSQCLLFIALLLFHYFLRYSPPLSSFLSAECCVAHRRVLCYSSPLVVILHRLLCHTPSCLQFFYKRSQFFIFFGFRFCFTFLASHNRSNLASTVEETSTALFIPADQCLADDNFTLKNRSWLKELRRCLMR